MTLKIVLILILSIAITYCGSNKSPHKHEKTIISEVPISERFKGKNWALPMPQLNDLKRVDGKGQIGIKASDCRNCHTKIYNEWKKSTHAVAYQDLQFQAEISKSSSPKWLCLNCHTPIQNQRKYIITHLENGNILKPIKKNNPLYDPKMREESITCAVCHIRSDQNGNSYVLGKTGDPDKLSPHPVKKAHNRLKNHCYACHNVFDQVTPDLSCWFKTGEELKNGPYVKNECVDCHMPPTKRPLVEKGNYPIRQVSQHLWLGGSVPKSYEAYDTLLERGFGGFEPALDIFVQSISNVNPKKKAKINIIYKNARAGHWLPTGDPERFIIIIAALEDRLGNEIFKKTLRIGQTWQWSPVAKQIADNRLKPKESRNWNIDIPLPDRLEGVKLIVTAMNVRLTPNNAHHMKKSSDVNKVFALKVKNLEDHYPFASYVFREEINLKENKRKKYGANELIELSKKRKGIIQLTPIAK